MQQLVSTILLVIMYFTNYLSTTGQLGTSMTNLAEIFPFPYMPPGITFSVARGAIYLLLGVYIIRGRTHPVRRDPLYTQLRPYFNLTCLLNIARLQTTAQERYVISVIVIIGLAVLLGYMLELIDQGRTGINKYFFEIPFGLYFGRISIATVVIATSQLVFLYDPSLAFHQGRITTVLAAGALVTIRSYTRRHNPAQFLISFWAFAWISVNLISYL